LKKCQAHDVEIWLKNHPNRVVTRYKITGLVGKAYLKSATAIFADEFRKQACFSTTVTYLMNMILEEYQRNITSFLLEISVPCSRIAEE
jgi:hypothetical protein